jgi:hypothetical protein
MIKKLLYFSFALFSINISAQNRVLHLSNHLNQVTKPNSTAPAVRSCGSMDYLEKQFEKNPELKQKRLDAMKQIAEKISTMEVSKAKSNVVHTIPVVVHVVYNNANENISDAQILSQIAVLNKDFRKLNTDFNNTINNAFGNVGSDAQIEFCMAQRDPSDQPTNGITRTSTNHGPFYTEDDVKFNSTGGRDAWNTNKYLNLWICQLSNSLLGYAQFPGGPAATDGVVVGYNYFGTIGAATSPYNKGRTATHEIGHWLELYHIWGDDNGSCSGDDLVSDTPNQKDQNGGCPSFPQTTQAGGSCSGTSPGSMFMNYMDYTDDACMYMFTAGQSARMNAALTTTRASLLSSNGCVAPGGGPTNPSCDTLTNWFTSYVQSVYANFSTTTWGYIAGHNNYTDIAKAEYFTTPLTGYQVSGCYIKFGRISYTNTSSSFDFKIWNSNGAGNSPNTVLGTKNVTYASVAADVVAGDFSLIQFTNPVPVAAPFYAGVEFAYSGTDTLAIYTNSINNMSPNTGKAWEKWSNGTWHNLNTPSPSGGWGLDLSLLMFPVICDSFVGINENAQDIADLIQVFPNPAKNELNVNISNLKSITISLYNINGSLIEELNSTNSNGIARFNTSNLSRGIYLMEIKNSSFKIIKKVVIE